MLQEQAAKRRHYVTTRRTEALDVILTELGQVERMERLLGSLPSDGEQQTGWRVAEFTKFAKDALEQKLSGLQSPQLEKRFESDRLFGDDDDAGFEPSRRPYWN